MALQLHCRAETHTGMKLGKEQGPHQAVDDRLYYFYFFSSQNGTKKGLCLPNMKKKYVIVFEKHQGFQNILPEYRKASKEVCLLQSKIYHRGVINFRS